MSRANHRAASAEKGKQALPLNSGVNIILTPLYDASLNHSTLTFACKYESDTTITNPFTSHIKITHSSHLTKTKQFTLSVIRQKCLFLNS